MDRRGQAATEQGKSWKSKGKAKMSDGGKDGGQQGIELSDMTNRSSAQPTGGGGGGPAQSTVPAHPGLLLPPPQLPAPLPTFQRSMPVVPRQTGNNLPPIRDVGQLIRRYGIEQTTVVGSCAGDDKPEASPMMPKAWTKDHDRLICYMDREGVSVEHMGRRLKHYLGDIKGGIPPPVQIDCRLRYLDQIPEINYWRSDDLPKRKVLPKPPAKDEPTRASAASKKKENVPAPVAGEQRASVETYRPLGRVNIVQMPVRSRPSNSSLHGLAQSHSQNFCATSHSATRGLSQSQSYHSMMRQGDNEPMTPTRPAITAESRRRDAAMRSSRSRNNLRTGSAGSLRPGRGGQASE